MAWSTSAQYARYADSAAWACVIWSGVRFAGHGFADVGVTVEAAPLDLTGKSSLAFDLKILPAAGSSVVVALQTGKAQAWCQGPSTWYGAGGTYQVSLDLLTGLNCADLNLSDVRAINVFIGSGTVDIDNLRAR